MQNSSQTFCEKSWPQSIVLLYQAPIPLWISLREIYVQGTKSGKCIKLLHKCRAELFVAISFDLVILLCINIMVLLEITISPQSPLILQALHTAPGDWPLNSPNPVFNGYFISSNLVNNLMMWDPEVLSINISWIFTVLNSNLALVSHNELWSAAMPLHLLYHLANETNFTWFKQKMVLLSRYWVTHPTYSML